ncbi:RICIN domain-containing protein [Streptomyces sp. NPDC088762]|uniref:RICIN domain-containing protein n=1 Tax=Streptomyces sp. NPDC088762 TaxID=3365891 RepID=UPI003817859F
MAVLAGAVMGGGAVAAEAPTDARRGADQCREGYEWRLTKRWDHVCIPSEQKGAIVFDDILANERKNPDTGSCRAGYVVRDAVPGDDICVEQVSRDIVREQNKAVAFGWVGTASRDPETVIVLHPFNTDKAVYTITSAYTDPKKPLVADVQGASTSDGASLFVWRKELGDNQRFWFRAARTRDDSVFQNNFEIIARHSGKCLDAAGFGTANGTKVIQYRCTGTINQKWYLWRRADNEWEIRSLQSSKCLDAHSPSLRAPQQEAVLQLWTCHGFHNQAWHLRSAK